VVLKVKFAIDGLSLFNEALIDRCTNRMIVDVFLTAKRSLSYSLTKDKSNDRLDLA